jgi:predicted transcriptional regulator
MTAMLVESPPLTNMESSRSIYNLEQAKFILSEILMNRHSIKKIAEELDSNERLVSELICFFIEIGWITSNTNGTCAITTKYKNIIERIETEM